MRELILLDLFSGIGGFPFGLQQAGFQFKRHYYSEIDPYAIASYQYNFKNSIYAGPIENIKEGSIPTPDIITFGSPCQDLSVAGKREGIKGSKSKLFFEAVRILELYKPRLFIFENVRGLFYSNQGKDFEIVLRSFAHLGVYELQWQLLNTAWFLPQNRERIYLVGSLGGQTRPQIFPVGESCQKAQNCSGKRLSQTNTAPTITTRAGDISNKNNPYVFTIRSGRKVPGGSKVEFRKDGSTNCITGVEKDNLLLGNWIPLKPERTEKAKRVRKANQRKGKDYVAFREKQLVPRNDGKMGAITTSPQNENLLYNLKNIRRLTPLECERLQGFPDHWTKYGIREGKKIGLSDSRRYRLIGNAVSPPVVTLIGKRIKAGNMFNQGKINLKKPLNPDLDGLGKPGKTPVSYYGGKQNLVKRILALIPRHNLYCEPFVGGAAVFFTKPPSPVEVINDLDGKVVNFYYVCKTQFPKLQKMIQATPHSRKLHTEAKEILLDSSEKDKIKKAWAFWVQTNMSFSSRIYGGYAYERKTNGVSRTILNKKNQFTKDICERLDLVDIECNDALKVIRSRDTKESFFYVDPPYFNSDMGHYKGYSEQDFTDLLELLSKIKGKFLLSSYPSDILAQYTRKYKWHQQAIEQTVSVTKGTRDKKKIEVFTANYNITKMDNVLNGRNDDIKTSILLKAKAIKLRFSLVKK
ncbi:DNA (cytosine-5-)-methyltransferase [Aquimarina sp. ERC-38]|uniref:DNA (cytosine-5-)-methyltransferase n=1 Tax=Aquimarina sp. ERC-38 TaxID=2949996 RepID=UPI002245B236|nr:DNA (cytosine-5-)-methyltransferase [Aquimarina sp. ERC-38]UZO81390.1 DNA (cytosine-5-)-methyltransferase [Aquimarina sp. ERC-38]